MTDALTLVGSFAIGAALGWWFHGRPPQTLMYCEACPSQLWVLNGNEVAQGTPTFPSGV